MSQGCSTYINEYGHHITVFNSNQTIDKAQAGLDRMAAEHGWQLVQAGGRS